MKAMTSPTLTLNGFSFEELFHPAGLQRLDDAFLTYLREQQAALHAQLLLYRKHDSAQTPIQKSELLIAVAPHLENFLAALFDIEEAVAISKIKTISLNPISLFKKYFVLRRAKKEMNRAKDLPSFAELDAWLTHEIAQSSFSANDRELAIALLATQFLDQPEINKTNIEKLVQWCTQALLTQNGQREVSHWTSFKIPQRLDYADLVKTVPVANDKYNRLIAPPEHLRMRDGFALTDARMNAREVQDEINYCIYCHDHDGDFCSKGFPVKKGDPAQGFKKNPLDVTLTGCPLEEKISEMHFLKREGHTLASLAVVMIDNPMCPATGHRICNECMKACIYQKQDPVNIPQIETRVLTDVLDLPWGVEIYDLLTRWNPLRETQWVTKPYNGLKVMIAGMGPAGFTLAHHLLLEGFAVVGFDGLKIEALNPKLIHEPIFHFKDLQESLDERLMAGFGGVAEYGITVRWDKNFLKLIYLSLMRRPHFQVFGGIRFGGTITVEDAWQLGFDHFVVAVGAGLPKALSIPNSLATGMRQANDFLMSLQLGNAAKKSSLTNLQIRLPAVVIGGGLTGVDTATELQAYYITQVEKIYFRYHALIKIYGETFLQQHIPADSQEILADYLRHGEAVMQERDKAKQEKRQPNFIKLMHEWGGVTIAYRRSMQESPAYINNHEELHKALQEGIYYLEGLEPSSVILNEHGHSEALICHKRIRNQANEWIATAEEVHLPARSILVATGTQPNIAYEFEHKGTFNRLNLQYQHYEDDDGQLRVAHGVLHCKDNDFGPFTSYQKNNQRVSLIGDTHPVFHGSVVKAIASGMRTYPKILAALKDKLSQVGEINEYKDFNAHMQYLFQASVVGNKRVARDVLELQIESPIAAKHFKPGQFYRLQNFETHAPEVQETLLQMEPLALVAANCDPAKGVLTFLVTENSATAKLTSLLKLGERVSLMGPTGVRTKIPAEHETILIIGDRSSFAFVRTYASAARAAGNRIIYFCLLEDECDLYDQTPLENATDMIIWLTKNNLVQATRDHDLSGHSENLIATLAEYAQGKLFHKEVAIHLADVDRIFVVGDAELLRTFQAGRNTLLKDYLVKDPKVFGSVYGNMQCMLKGVCAQCLQWQIDPETGQRTKAVFACSWQDQPLEIIDIDHIEARQEQNSLLEKISNLWIDHLFEQFSLARV